MTYVERYHRFSASIAAYTEPVIPLRVAGLFNFIQEMVNNEQNEENCGRHSGYRHVRSIICRVQH